MPDAYGSNVRKCFTNTRGRGGGELLDLVEVDSTSVLDTQKESSIKINTWSMNSLGLRGRDLCSFVFLNHHRLCPYVLYIIGV